jgi:hypothetical protein
MGKDLIPSGKGKKYSPSFWDTKEGTTGMIGGAAIFGGLGWGAYKIMPYIANLMENTVYAIAFGAVAVFLFYALVIDDKLRKNAWLFYQRLMRAITYSIVKWDPTEILQITLQRARDRLQRVDAGRARVSGNMATLKRTLDGYKEQAEKFLSEAKYLQSHHGDQDQISSRAMKLQELNNAYQELQPLYLQLNGWYDNLNKARSALTTMIGNMEFKIELETEKYDVVRSAHSTFRLIRSAFTGSDEIEGLQGLAFKIMADDYNQKIGEIDTFMLDSKPFLESEDLRVAVNTEKGMKLLEELSRRNIGIIASDVTTVEPHEHQPVGGQPGAADASGKSGEASYTNFLKK